jgi:hypothetical protein
MFMALSAGGKGERHDEREASNILLASATTTSHHLSASTLYCASVIAEM